MKTKILITLSILFIFSLFGCQNSEKSESETKSSKVEGAASISGESSGSNTEVDETQNKAEKDDKKTEQTKNRIETIYTDLEASKCKTTESNEEEAWSVQECPGVAGYKLQVTEGDLRQTINVLAPSGEKYELDFTQKVSSAFSSFGNKAEWRVKKSNGKIQPIALITRYNVSENPEDSSKLTSYLVVIKFDGEFICITDIVKPIKDANVKARELADVAATKPCLQK